MRFFTRGEAEAWCRSGVAALDDKGLPVRPSAEPHHARREIPRDYTRLTWFCRHLEEALRPRDSCLLWVTEWGVWQSSENLHLFYQLRRGYGELRLLHEAPATLFLDFEGPELVTFLQIGILSGWDMYLIPAVGYTRAFLSHDEYVEIAATADNAELVEAFTAPLDSNTNGG
jgi:hypothetical protein